MPLDPGVAEPALHPHHLAMVALEPEDVARTAQLLLLTQKPSEEILEGFNGERFSPARGRCGLRRG
ncbi:MAG: hypothetical protein ACRDM9_06935 [Gaiellaceae bacterium]